MEEWDGDNIKQLLGGGDVERVSNPGRFLTVEKHHI
jgi:hypothetical protein